jgi:Ca2+-binding RTX toxin-like protein
VTANAGEDVIHTGGGNDTINAGDGHNRIEARDGSNEINTLSGNDTIISGTGADRITAGEGYNQLNAGGGNNHITSGNHGSRIIIGSGNDTVITGEGHDAVYLTGDTPGAGGGKDDIKLGGGNDTAYFVNYDYKDLSTEGGKIDGGAGIDTFVFYLRPEEASWNGSSWVLGSDWVGVTDEDGLNPLQALFASIDLAYELIGEFPNDPISIDSGHFKLELSNFDHFIVANYVAPSVG